MFWKKAEKPLNQPFDPKTQTPVLRCSICTGEQVAGFKDKRTGEFLDVLYIREPGDLDRFLKQYGLTSIQKEY